MKKMVFEEGELKDTKPRLQDKTQDEDKTQDVKIPLFSKSRPFTENDKTLAELLILLDENVNKLSTNQQIGCLYTLVYALVTIIASRCDTAHIFNVMSKEEEALQDAFTVIQEYYLPEHKPE